MQAFAKQVRGPRLNMEFDVRGCRMFARAKESGRGTCRHSQRTRPEQVVFQRELEPPPDFRHAAVERRNAAFECGPNLEVVLQIPQYFSEHLMDR